MKRKFTFLMAAVALLCFMLPPMTGWGQTKITDYSNIVSGNTYYIGATTGGTDYYLYVYHDYNSTSTAGTAKTSMNDASTFVFEGSGTSWTVKFDNGKYLSLKDDKDNGKVQVVTDPATFTTSNQSGKIRLSKGNYSVQKNNSGTQFGSYANTQTDIWLMEVPSGLALTTVTIDHSGITNTDVYTSTVAGSLSATVTENTNNTVISGATVTWSSSNVNVATVANDGSVTLVAEGTTTITAYYAGVNGEYGESSATYELNVSDSTPFTGGDVTFVAGTDLGTTSATGPDSMTKQVVTVSSTSAAFATAEYRLYSGSETTISTSFGTITQIEFTKNGNYSLGNLSTETGNYTSTTGIWTGDAQEVTFNAAAQVRLDKITVTISAPSTVATPTFNPSSGTEFGNEGLSVTINCETTGVSIYYTLDGSTPNNTSSLYGGTINLTTTTTINAIAYDGTDYSTVATATYTYVDPNAPGTENNPYTVAKAIANTPSSGTSDVVYIHGIVSGFYNTSIVGDGSNYRYYISDDGTTTNQLLVYKGKGLNNIAFSDANELLVGDEVTILGGLTMYNNAPEVASGNYLTSWHRPTSTEPTITLSSYSIEAPAAGSDGTLTVTYNNIETSAGVEIKWCDETGTILADQTTYEGWLLAVFVIGDINTIEYTINENTGTARPAYFKVYGIDGDDNDVYSNLVTINQAAPVVDYATLPFNWAGGTREDLVALNGVSGVGLGSNYAESNAPYRVKFDNDGDYILIKTDQQPVGVKVIVKMLGGANTSYIAVQASNDGVTFDSGESLEISGAQNTVLTLSSTRTFDVNARYVKLLFTKGSNVGVGPISIAKQASFNTTVNGYDSKEGGYHLIASPIDGVNPVNAGMIKDNLGNTATVENSMYDLYWFNQAEVSEEWQNYRQEAFNLEAGKGYLYASKETAELTFDGKYFGNGTVNLTFDESATFAGYNLIGNPFTCTAYLSDNRDFLRMNTDGNAIVLATDKAINVCEGIFVMATATETSVTLTTTEPTPDGASGSNNGMVNISVDQVVNSRDTQPSADYARIRINNGKDLPKFVFNESTSRVYIPQNGKDYAVVRSAAQGELPVNFKAAENGTYTINVATENLDVEYLHLVDNLTGADVDLLATPSYTFEGRKNDYTSRFRLIFSANDSNNSVNDDFAFISNGNLVVNGTGTLQVIDMLGRQLLTHEVTSDFRLLSSDFLTSGVYVLQLVNGNEVKTQKIVVR